jgi:hypothetical protein
VVHDAEFRPRHISEFSDITPFGAWVGALSAASKLPEGTTHVEVAIKQLFPQFEVLTIDISGGAAAVRQSLEEFCHARSVDVIIAIDVGGDALCTGFEPTLRSPLCDQTMLAALHRFQHSYLGVFGLGSDGELPLADFQRRFNNLLAQDAYLGAIPLEARHVDLLERALTSGKSECSRLPLAVFDRLERRQIDACGKVLNTLPPALHAIDLHSEHVPLRSGKRVGELSILSVFTLFFQLSKVYAGSRFPELIDESAPLTAAIQRLKEAGIVTEIEENLELQA